MMATRKIGCGAILICGLALVSAHAQDFGASRSAVKNDPVQYLFPEQVAVPANQSSPVTLHFRIAQGLHINSHTPTRRLSHSHSVFYS